MSEKWPFIIIRIFGAKEGNEKFLELLYEWNAENPNIIGELWFAVGDLRSLEKYEPVVKDLKSIKAKCLESGIKFSLQQGGTLGHYPAPHMKNYKHFDTTDWAVDYDGNVLYGVLCANSENVREYSRKVAETFIGELGDVSSYWVDDDLRLIYKGFKEICFCDRCIQKFNEMFNYNFDRASLKAKLIGENSSGEIRKNWTIFNSKSLGEYANSFAQAVENLNSDCRLGLQAVYSSWIYDGPDLLEVLKGLSGKNNWQVGIRPGACYYNDHRPVEMLEKSLAVMQEANRCATYGNLVGQVCYEAENWPHISALKSPSAQLTECALALASGCDSLALYWGSDKNRESDENYRFYWQYLKKFYPYFETIRRVCQNTETSGIAFYRGSDLYQTPRWQIITDSVAESRLIHNSLPIVRGGKVNAWVVDCATVEELNITDLPKLFSESVMLDIAAFEALAKKFPELAWQKKVEFISLDPNNVPFYEIFEHDYTAMNMKKAILPKSSDVVMCSKTNRFEECAGSCIIPTEFGGKVLLIQETAYASLWTGYRRKMILDAIDSMTVNKIPARLMTDGFSIYPIIRVRNNGEVAGVFLVNTSIGETMDLKLAIRDGGASKYLLHQVGTEAKELEIFEKLGDEVILNLPALNGWQSIFIECVK